MPYKIKVNRTLCIGAGSCEAIAPRTFNLDPGGKVMLKTKDGRTVEEALDSEVADGSDMVTLAAKACPVNAITIIEVDEDGNEVKQIWPI